MKRLALLAALVAALIVVSALLYQAGMSHLEGKHRTFWESLEWAMESISTTGYGYDNHWNSPAMVLLVIGVQFIGVFLIFLIIPIFLVPFLDERFQEKLPRDAGDVAHHVVIYRFGPAVETLVQSLVARDVPVVVIETDETRARELQEHGRAVVFSRNEEEVLDGCRLGAARAFVANGRDEENASVVLRARQMGFRGEIYSFVQNPVHRKPMELAGATIAFTPRHIVAAALAAHASDALSPRLAGIDAIPGLVRGEIRIPPDSRFAGRTLADTHLSECGAVVVGQWSRTRLDARCQAAMRLEPGCILEVVGTDVSIDEAARHLDGIRLRSEGPLLIGGFGEVGRKLHEILTDAGEQVRVVERQPGPGVDCAGDVLDPAVLRSAGIAESRALLLALDSDDATLFATVIARDLAPGVAVFARVNHGRNLENLHRAGADYVLSISDVSGELLTSKLLGRSSRAREAHRSVARVPAAPFAGRLLRESAFRAKYQCSVIAVDRGGELLTRVGPDLRIEEHDELWVCGRADDVRELSA